MASSSGRKSGSSGRSTSRKRVVIGADETVRVRYRHDTPEVESERRPKRARKQEGQPSSASRAGKRLADSKRQERERRQQLVRFRRVAVIAGIAAVAVACLWALVALYRAPLFEVKSITVEGIRHFDRRGVLAIADVPKGATLLRLSTRAVRERLEADPWIADATVSRDFPDGLNIVVVERTPAAVVDGGGDRLWVVSGDNRWLGVRSAEETGLVLIRDVGSIEPTAGAIVREPQVANAVRVIRGLSDELRGTVKVISAPTVDETKLETAKDVEIFIGEATDIAEKDRIVRAILKKQKGKVVYINVRVLDRPTWRGLEPEGQ